MISFNCRYSLICLLLMCSLVFPSSSWAADAGKAKNATSTPPAKTQAASKGKTELKAAPAGKSSGLPKVIDFGAVWCVPCKKFAPTFDRIAANYKGKVDFEHIDVESKTGKPVADKYKVEVMPTIMFFDAKGKVVERIEGKQEEATLVKNTEALLK